MTETPHPVAMDSFIFSQRKRREGYKCKNMAYMVAQFGYVLGTLLAFFHVTK